jgi:hypothetical protein
MTGVCFSPVVLTVIMLLALSGGACAGANIGDVRRRQGHRPARREMTMGHLTSAELWARLNPNDAPTVGKVDKLLEALQREHGADGRPDIAEATIPRPWKTCHPTRKEAGEWTCT